MPETIAHYRLVSKLGEGGMGVVYAAADERLHRHVALKMVRGTSRDPQSRERLWREARAAASVSHPNVCQLYEVGEANGELFIAMELLEGEPLSARLARGPIPLAETVDITLAMLSALGAIHAQRLVHRDLKPSNVFLTPHGVKLLDFGLARTVQHAGGQTGDGITMTGTVMGTPHYMSPEQLTGQPLDAQSDLFAVGAILFELLVGEVAFPGATMAEVFHGVMNEPLPSVGGSPALAAVDRVIHRATAKRLPDRYARADTMAQDLRAVLRLADSGDTPVARRMTRLIVLPFRMLRSGPRDRLSLVQPRRRHHRLARQPRVAGRAHEPRGRAVRHRCARPGRARRRARRRRGRHGHVAPRGRERARGDAARGDTGRPAASGRRPRRSPSTTPFSSRTI